MQNYHALVQYTSNAYKIKKNPFTVIKLDTWCIHVCLAIHKAYLLELRKPNNHPKSSS